MTRADAPDPQQDAPDALTTDNLRKTMDLLRRLHWIDPNMQLGEILVFLHVALNPKP